MASEPFLAGIYLFAGNFAPQGYALCNGQLLSIAQNTALFALIGTYYGGNGTNTFALPNLQGRVPVHQGNGAGLSSYSVGQQGGAETTTLLINQMPVHNHPINVSNVAGTSSNPAGGYPAMNNVSASGSAHPIAEAPNFTSVSEQSYATAPVAGQTMASGAVGNTGGNQPVGIIQPYLAVTYIIALEGIFPSRS